MVNLCGCEVIQSHMVKPCLRNKIQEVLFILLTPIPSPQCKCIKMFEERHFDKIKTLNLLEPK